MAGEPRAQAPFKSRLYIPATDPGYSELTNPMNFASAVFAEAYPMTDQMKSSKLTAIAETGGKAVNHTVPLIRAAVLAVSVAAAIPTAQNLYYAWKHDVPFNEVQHRLSQAGLWEKNYDCKIDYRPLQASPQSKVDVGSCAKTGDISIKISGAKGQVNYEWIAFEQLPKPAAQNAGLLGLIVSQALAEELSKPASSAAPVRVADAAMEVMCQAKQKDTVVRVVKEAAKCFRETVSLFKGSVEKREEVACDKACPVAN